MSKNTNIVVVLLADVLSEISSAKIYRWG